MAATENLAAGTEEPEKGSNVPDQGTSTPGTKEHPRTITGWKVSILIQGSLLF